MGERKTILVVEDHPGLRSEICAVVSGMGHLALEATDGASARSLLSNLRPDLVCLDLVLPESSGYELCEFVRNSPAHQATRILIVSDRGYPADRAQAAEAGAAGFLVRPFAVEELRRTIESLLDPGGPFALAS